MAEFELLQLACSLITCRAVCWPFSQDQEQVIKQPWHTKNQVVLSCGRTGDAPRGQAGIPAWHCQGSVPLWVEPSAVNGTFQQGIRPVNCSWAWILIIAAKRSAFYLPSQEGWSAFSARVRQSFQGGRKGKIVSRFCCLRARYCLHKNKWWSCHLLGRRQDQTLIFLPDNTPS